MANDAKDQTRLNKTSSSEIKASDEDSNSAIAPVRTTRISTSSPASSTSSAHSHENGKDSRGFLEQIKELDPALRFLIGLITLVSITTGVLKSFQEWIISPGPRMEKTAPIAVGDTVMIACLVRNNGSGIEKDIWMTLRTEPSEPYELSFQGAEGFAHLREDGGQERHIVENEVVLIRGIIARVEFDRLAPGQTIVIAAKHPRSATISCDITGSSGSLELPGIRVLSNSDYLILISLFIVTAFSIVAASEFMRRRAEKQGFREPNMDSTKNQGDS